MSSVKVTYAIRWQVTSAQSSGRRPDMGSWPSRDSLFKQIQASESQSVPKNHWKWLKLTSSYRKSKDRGKLVSPSNFVKHRVAPARFRRLFLSDASKTEDSPKLKLNSLKVGGSFSQLLSPDPVMSCKTRFLSDRLVTYEQPLYLPLPYTILPPYNTFHLAGRGAIGSHSQSTQQPDRSEEA
ncbi:hypothetical protein B0H19DRAFT_1070132 [Mycena capillaripes]|nr:hypothetical protein B0H19DRAFT_1070132 [Mycena capillaripes]